MNDLIKRLTEKAIEFNFSGELPLRNLLREARDALQTACDNRDALEQLLGVLLLEYHNMDWLSGDNASRNRGKREIVAECLHRLS